MQLNNKSGFSVPESFLIEPFYSEPKMINFFNNGALDEMLKIEPFYFDMLELIKITVNEMPWNNIEHSVPLVISHWKKTKLQLQEKFAGKRFSVKNETISMHGISLFIICLFWTNERSVKSLEVKEMMIAELKHKPINCEERLLFIINKPSLYHSFIQLDQMFKELEKIFYKTLAIKRL